MRKLQLCYTMILVISALTFSSANAQTSTATPMPPPKFCINSSCSSAASSATGVKFHPGHYCASDETYDNSSVADLEGEIDSCLGGSSNASIQGYLMRIFWTAIETSQNNYSWSAVDSIRSYIATKYPGKRLGVEIEWDNYFNHNCVPSYVLNTSTYGQGYTSGTYGMWAYTGNGCTAAWWRPAVYNRIIAVYQSLANHTSPYGSGYTYDTDPYFEMVTGDESSLPFPTSGSDTCGQYGCNPPDYSTSTGVSGWEALTAGIVNVFPHTAYGNQDNFLSSSEVAMDCNAGSPLSGPDINPFNEFVSGFAASAYIGASGSSGSMFGSCAYITQVEFPDYSQGGSPSVGQLFNTAVGAAPNGLNSYQIWWTNCGTAGCNSAGQWSIVAAFASSNPIPAANTVCPTRYASRGGCNIN
jgi:hypothetical protein